MGSVEVGLGIGRAGTASARKGSPLLNDAVGRSLREETVETGFARTDVAEYGLVFIHWRHTSDRSMSMNSIVVDGPES